MLSRVNVTSNPFPLLLGSELPVDTISQLVEPRILLKDLVDVGLYRRHIGSSPWSVLAPLQDAFQMCDHAYNKLPCKAKWFNSK